MKKIIIVALISWIPLAGYTQNNTKKPVHKHAKTVKTANATILPQWAAEKEYNPTTRAYLPDYYSYYDPERGGYVYWQNGQYSFTPATAPYAEKAEGGKSELRLSKAFSLDLHPQLDYPYYMTLYPVVQGGGNSSVPVPLTDNPAQR